MRTFAHFRLPATLVAVAFTLAFTSVMIGFVDLTYPLDAPAEAHLWFLPGVLELVMGLAFLAVCYAYASLRLVTDSYELAQRQAIDYWQPSQQELLANAHLPVNVYESPAHGRLVEAIEQSRRRRAMHVSPSTTYYDDEPDYNARAHQWAEDTYNSETPR